MKKWRPRKSRCQGSGLNVSDCTLLTRDFGCVMTKLSDELYQEGEVSFSEGDALVVYSDGLIDALPEKELDNAVLAEVLGGVMNAEEMVERLSGIVPQGVTMPDDLTVLVVHCIPRS